MAKTTRTPETITADLEKAREQFRSIYEAESALRARIKADHEYRAGVYADGKPKRWKQAEITARGDRPTLSIDAMSGPIAQVTNGIAEGKPAADMVPLGGGSNDDAAEVWEGLLRRIQTAPEAEYAGAYAAEHLVGEGRGAWVLTARYPDYNGKPNDPANWDMEISREWIENQHAVWLGPATRPDGSDRLFGFILHPLTKELFDARFGDGEFEKNKSALDSLNPDGASATAWSGPQTITIASWYRVTLTDVTLSAVGPDGQPVSRVVKERRVCVSTITATHEYEYSELPIPYIPIVMGEAKRSNIDGEKDVKGMVRAMKDPQDLVNVWPSYIAETIPMSARQEVFAYEGQIDNTNAKFWDMSKRLPYRLAKAETVDGKLAPLPKVQNFEAPIQAMTQALQQAEGFVRKAAGFYDADSDQTRASLSKESGVARQVRQQQGELGNSDFARAYAFMILYEIKILLAWCPHVYSAARLMRIVGRDQEPFTAVTHFGASFAPDAQQIAQQMPQQPKAEPPKIYNLADGRYEFKARVIKNPLTQRQENVDLLQNVLPALPPEMAAKALPIMFDEMDGSVMKRVAAAIKPPDEQTVSIEDAQKAQQVIDEQARIIEELTRKAEAKSDESASRERIAQMDNATKVRLEELKFDHEFRLKQLEIEAQQRAAVQQAALSAVSADTQHEHDLDAGDHAAAREFALREPEAPAQEASA